jgi:hypothetical protein
MTVTARERRGDAALGQVSSCEGWPLRPSGFAMNPYLLNGEGEVTEVRRMRTKRYPVLS